MEQQLLSWATFKCARPKIERKRTGITSSNNKQYIQKKFFLIVFQAVHSLFFLSLSCSSLFLSFLIFTSRFLLCFYSYVVKINFDIDLWYKNDKTRLYCNKDHVLTYSRKALFYCELAVAHELLF